MGWSGRGLERGGARHMGGDWRQGPLVGGACAGRALGVDWIAG